MGDRLWVGKGCANWFNGSPPLGAEDMEVERKTGRLRAKVQSTILDVRDDGPGI